MNYPVSQVSSIRQNHQRISPTTEPSRTPDFTRTRADASVDGSKFPQSDGVKYTQIARGPAPVGLQRSAQIPPNPGPISPRLSALQSNCRILMSMMGNSKNPAFHQQGVPFMTHRGEPGLIKYETDGMTSIHVNGKPTFKCFNDNHYPGDTHILMRGPDERMYAGRSLPQDYLQEGSALVHSAQNALAGSGPVQRMTPRWGH